MSDHQQVTLGLGRRGEICFAAPWGASGWWNALCRYKWSQGWRCGGLLMTGILEILCSRGPRRAEWYQTSLLRNRDRWISQWSIIFCKFILGLVCSLPKFHRLQVALFLEDDDYNAAAGRLTTSGASWCLSFPSHSFHSTSTAKSLNLGLL